MLKFKAFQYPSQFIDPNEVGPELNPQFKSFLFVLY
jgi:hypothetical protein